MPDLSQPDPGDLDLPITEYLARRPEAVSVFLDLRLGCVGCDFSAFDSLRQALGIHGISIPTYLDRLERIRPPASSDTFLASIQGEAP